MVYWRVAEWLAERKEPWTRYRLVKESGLSPTVIYRLARRGEPVQRIDGRTLDTLCATLGAQPGDLLEYVPTRRTRTTRKGRGGSRGRGGGLTRARAGPGRQGRTKPKENTNGQTTTK